jgi:hypothetical protein
VAFVSAAPASDETAAAQTAARELFVETLLVRLAESMKANAGADVLEMALAEAAADVGGALEDAYRTAHRITGRGVPPISWTLDRWAVWPGMEDQCSCRQSRRIRWSSAVRRFGC